MAGREPSRMITDRAVMAYRATVLGYLADIVAGRDDLPEVVRKLEGIAEAGEELLCRLAVGVDDRDATVPPVDMSWVR